MRLALAYSSLSPIILLLGIRGEGLLRLPDLLFFCGCMLGAMVGLVVIPWYIISRAKSDRVTKPLEVGSITLNKDHPMVYSVAVILPLWAANVDDWRNALAAFVAFLMIWALFTVSDLHHANLTLRILGYKIYTVDPPPKAGLLGGSSFLVLSKRTHGSTTKILHTKILDSALLIEDSSPKE